MTNTMTLFEKIATIGTIDTPEMRTAIYGLNEISDLHKYALCSCLNSVEFRVKNGESVDAILQYGYEQIMPGLQPTPDALTDGQTSVCVPFLPKRCCRRGWGLVRRWMN